MRGAFSWFVVLDLSWCVGSVLSIVLFLSHGKQSLLEFQGNPFVMAVSKRRTSIVMLGSYKRYGACYQRNVEEAQGSFALGLRLR